MTHQTFDQIHNQQPSRAATFQAHGRNCHPHRPHNARDIWSLGPKHTTLKYSSAWNSGLFQTFSFGVTQHGAFGPPPHLTENLAEDLTRGEAHRPHTLFPTGDQITLALFLLEFIPDAGSGGLLSWQFPEATHFFHQNISTDHAVSMNSFYGHICHNTTLV